MDDFRPVHHSLLGTGLAEKADLNEGWSEGDKK